MNLFRFTVVLMLAALASACASAPPSSTTAAPVESTLVDGTAGTPASTAYTTASELPATPPIDVPPEQTATAGDATAAEDDYAAIYGNGQDDGAIADPSLPQPVGAPQIYDPWEKFNRKVHGFNNVVDRAVARPLAIAYTSVVPRPVRLGVSNFFDNLGQPIAAVNHLLQGQPKMAGQAFARFLLNSTLGIAGIFDPASDAKLPRRSEDFGQTLGVWGWKKSRYLELPFFGPRTVRDTLGMAGDAPLGVVRQIENDRTRIFLQGLSLVDVRAQLLSVDSLREGAVDDYTLVRDSWLQRRAYMIESNSKKKAEDESLPDYFNDADPDPTVPLDSMPVPVLTPGN